MLNAVARSCAVAVIATVAAPAQAALFEAFTGAWAPDISGTLRNGTTFDLKRDLGIDADPQREYVLYFRPEKRWYWPDLSAGFDHLGAQGYGRAAATVTFDGLPIQANSLLYSTISINDYDVSADIPFNLYGVHFGAGLSVKYLVGDVLVNTISSNTLAGVPVTPTTNGTSDTRVNQVFPLAHLRAETELASWLSLVGSGRYVEYDGNRAYELRGQVDLRPWGPVSLTAGYQRKSYLVSSGNYRLNTNIDGVFFGVGLQIK